MKELEVVSKKSEIVLELTKKDNKLSIHLNKLNNDLRKMLVRNDVVIYVMKK